MTPLQIAIAAPDIIDSGYSGLGLRSLGMAEALGRQHHVSVLAAGRPDYLPTPGIDLRVGPEAHDRALARADVVITSNGLRVRQLARSGAALVSDLYDPSYFEWLVQSDEQRTARRPWMARTLSSLRRSLLMSDVVLCANERQRDLYLGALLASDPLRRVLSHDERAMSRRVLVVPNGISPSERLPSREEARARLGFDERDVVFLWGGGVWDWMDADTVLQAALAAHARDSRIRLAFLGLRRGEEPDPHALRAEELLGHYCGAHDRSAPVLVNERWASPLQRLDFLAAADAGILGQRDTLETHFSFRTRLMDCLQAGLPVLSMQGDALSEQAAREGWGLTSGLGDRAGMTANMVRLAADEPLRRRLQANTRDAARAMTWDARCRVLSEVIGELRRPRLRQRVSRTTALLPPALHAGYTHVRRRVGKGDRWV